MTNRGKLPRHMTTCRSGTAFFAKLQFTARAMQAAVLELVA